MSETRRVLYSEAQIRAAVAGIAAAIDSDYRGIPVHLLGVLKGSFVFLADLVRLLRADCSVDFVQMSSYGTGTVSSGAVVQRLRWTDPVQGRHVIVVEEIVDSGLTLSALLQELEGEQPASLRVCALIDKRGARRVDVPVHYRGFVLDHGFVIGYGLDLAERHRGLPAVHVVEPKKQGR